MRAEVQRMAAYGVQSFTRSVSTASDYVQSLCIEHTVIVCAGDPTRQECILALALGLDRVGSALWPDVIRLLPRAGGSEAVNRVAPNVAPGEGKNLRWRD